MSNTLEFDYKILEKDFINIENLKNEIFISNEKNKRISDFIEYIFLKKGKNIRTNLTLMFSYLNGNPNNSTYISSLLLEILHEATLLHDDVVDTAIIRRGRETANMIFGNKITVLMGDFLLSKMIEFCTKFKEFKLLGILSKTLVDLTKGELIQLEELDNFEFIFENKINIAKQKTASLLKACCISGYMSNCEKVDENIISKIEDFGNNFGIAYQIKDDILDFTNKEKELYKDIKEGKINIALALILKNLDIKKQNEVLSELKKSNDNDFSLEYWNKFVSENDLILNSEKLYNYYFEKSINILDTIPNSNNIKKYIYSLFKREN